MTRMDQLRTMLQTKPDDVFLNFSLAMELNAAGHFDDAVCQFDKTIALDKNYLPAYERKGQALIKLNRFAAARAALTTGAELAQAAGDHHMVDNLNHILDLLP